MSYVNSIPTVNRNKYTIIPDWNTYYLSVQQKFNIKHPQGDFSQVTLELENKIFPNNVHITGEIDCSIEFINCYFQSELVFYDVKIKKSVMSRQCFCDSEFRIMKTSIFESDFHIADFSAKDRVFIEGGIYQSCNWSFIDNGIVNINGGNFKSLILGYWGEDVFSGN